MFKTDGLRLPRWISPGPAFSRTIQTGAPGHRAWAFVVRKRVRVIAVAAFVVLAASQCAQIRDQPDIPWKNGIVLRHNGVVLYAQTGMLPAEAQEAMDFSTQTRQKLARLFFTRATIEPINIAVYRSIDQYNQNTPGNLPSMGHYRRNTRTIHIAYPAIESYLKHEMSHALLESIRPGSPFWLHEGLAYLVHFNEIPAPIRCDEPLAVHLPSTLQAFLQELRARPELSVYSELTPADPDLTVTETVTAAYFVLYLWDQKKLTPLIRSYLAPENAGATPQHLLTGGDLQKWDSLMQAFQKWVHSPKPMRPMYGC